MSQSQNLRGATGLIRVAGLEVTVTPLSQSEEIALDRALRRGVGDVYTLAQPELDALKAHPADRLEFLRELARLAVRREPPSPVALYDFRCSPKGVALELWFRGRRATTGLTLAALEAVITEVNADEVAAGIQNLLDGADGPPGAEGPPGNAATR